MKEELRNLLQEKFPDKKGLAVIRYKQDGEIKHRFVMCVSEPIKNQALISAEPELRRVLGIVAPNSEFIGYAVA